jgi:hypothetical protein
MNLKLLLVDFFPLECFDSLSFNQVMDITFYNEDVLLCYLSQNDRHTASKIRHKLSAYFLHGLVRDRNIRFRRRASLFRQEFELL